VESMILFDDSYGPTAYIALITKGDPEEISRYQMINPRGRTVVPPTPINLMTRKAGTKHRFYASSGQSTVNA